MKTIAKIILRAIVGVLVGMLLVSCFVLLVSYIGNRLSPTVVSASTNFVSLVAGLYFASTLYKLGEIIIPKNQEELDLEPTKYSTEQNIDFFEQNEPQLISAMGKEEYDRLYSEMLEHQSAQEE